MLLHHTGSSKPACWPGSQHDSVGASLESLCPVSAWRVKAAAALLTMFGTHQLSSLYVRSAGFNGTCAAELIRHGMALNIVRWGLCRIGRMVRHPVVGSIGQTLWNFSSRSQAFIQPTQGLQGENSADLLHISLAALHQQ